MRLSKLLVGSLAVNVLLGGLVVTRVVGRLARRSTPAPSEVAIAPTEQLEGLAVAGDADRSPRTQMDVVMLGDSLTQRTDWSALLGRPIANRGVSGDTIELVRRRLGAVVALRPKVLFLLIGINDLLGGTPPERVAEQHAQLVKEIRTRLPETRVVVEALLPVREALLRTQDEFVSAATVVKTNALIAKANGGPTPDWLDANSLLADSSGQLDSRFTSDGLHLSGAGYRVWADELRRYLP
jgi:lysophospholipase L1-like esterase